MGVTMRNMTRDEIVSETLHRVALRRGTSPTRLDRDLVTLIAEVVDLAREQVPECYVQSTFTPPTRPGRLVRPSGCLTCGGTGYVLQVACPDCQGLQAG